MLKFKFTLKSGLVVEHFAYTIIQAIKYVEYTYGKKVVKVELE